MLSCGIDTHKKMHQIEVQNQNGMVMWRGQITNDKKGFDRLLEKLRTVEISNDDRIIGVFINPTGTYHVPLQHFLASNGYSVHYVDARITDYARKMHNLGKVKSDKVDAAMLASTPWIPQIGKSVVDRPIHERDPASGLTRLYQSVKKNITRITNIIESDIACIFPEFTDMFSDIVSATSMALLEQLTIPPLIVNSGIENVLKIMRKASWGHYKKEDAERLMELARNSVGISDVNGVYAFRIRENVSRLRNEQLSLDRIEKQTLKLVEGKETLKFIDDIRGMGTMNAATIVSEIGDIKQFDSALKLQSYGGRAPNMEGSGGKNHATGLSKNRNPYLSHAVHQSVISLVKWQNGEFFEIYQREIDKGKKDTQAYIVVGRRLLYHIFSIMKNNKPYRDRLPVGGSTELTNTSL